MKVALCLFGLAGGSVGKMGKGDTIDPAIAYKHYKEHILSKNDIDVYFHTWESDVSQKIIDLYKPVSHEVDTPVVFDKNPDKQRAFSRWYSTRRSIDLIKGDYDIVMLSRFDVAFFSDVIFSDYDPEYFYASHWNDVGNRKNHTRGLLDLWFFGGQDLMRRFGQLSLYLDKYDVSQHKAAQKHITSITDKIKYTLYRGEDFELVRRAILESKE